MKPSHRLWLAVAIIATTAALWLVSSSRNSQPSTTASLPPNSQTTDNRPLPRQMSDRLLALMRAETDPAQREAAAQHAAAKIPRALLPAVLAELKNEPDRALAALAARALLLRWAWEEPTDAAAWTIQFAEGEIRRDALAAVGAGWALKNPEALMNWTASLPATERDWVLLHGAASLARTDLRLFSTWLGALPASRETDQLSAQTAREWAARDPRAVAAALSEFSSEQHAPWRQNLAAGLANELSLTSNSETAFALLDTLPAIPEKRQVLTGVVLGWTRRDPVVVATWLDRVTDQTLRTEMSALLVGEWLTKDTAAAETWATALPEGPVSDAVAQRAAQYYAPRDPAAARRWTARISSPEARAETTTYIQTAQPLQPAP